MDRNTSKRLRVLLLVYAIVMGLYGLVHVVSPELVLARDPAIERVLGVAVVAFAFGAGLAYGEKVWARVRLVVVVLIVWMILYTVTMAWGILAGGIDPMAWAPTALGAVFAVLLTAFYLREMRTGRG